MKKSIFLTFLLTSCLISTGLIAQTESEGLETVISGKIDGFPNNEIKIIYSSLSKTYVKQEATSDGSGEFRFKDEYKAGNYAIYLPAHKVQIPIIVNNESKIELNIEISNSEPNVTIIESEENKILHEAYNFYTKQNIRRKKILDSFEGIETEEKTKKKAELQAELQAEFKTTIDDYLVNMKEDHPGLYAPKFLKTHQERSYIDCADASDKKKCEEERYQDAKLHYFDNLDFSDPRTTLLSSLFTKINYYLDNMLLQTANGIIPEVDELLTTSNIHPDVFKDILIFTVNKYAKTKVIGLDEVYVHLVDKYYSEEKTPWLKKENLQDMKNSADEIRPFIIGNKLENIRFVDEYTSREFNLYDMKAERILFCTVGVLVEENEEKLKAISEKVKSGTKILIISAERNSNFYTLAEKSANIHYQQISWEKFDSIKKEMKNNFYFLDQDFKILFKKFSLEQFEDVYKKLGE